MANYDALVTEVTLEEATRTYLDVLERANLPVLAWQDTSFPRATLEFEARMFAEVAKRIVQIGKMGVEPEGDWLDLEAQQAGITRHPARAAVGTLTLREALGVPQTWAAGEFAVTSSASDVVYRAAGSVSLAANGTVAVTVTADRPGAAANRDIRSLGLATPRPGVSIVLDAVGTGWLTTPGQDRESDSDLDRRITLGWAKLARHAPADAYESAVRDAVPAITRVQIFTDPTAGFPGTLGWHVTAYVATATGAPSSADVEAADLAIGLAEAPGNYARALAATPVVLDVNGVLECLPGRTSGVASRVAELLQAYAASLPIGGTVIHAEIIRVAQSVPGVRKAALKLGLQPLTADGETPLALGQIAALSFSASVT